jgi:class 3 adenylate cyclase
MVGNCSGNIGRCPPTMLINKEFGSDDPFVEALQAARWMSEHNAHNFSPHIGIASGPVTVGYVGTPMKCDCSVFGAPVALAARC